MKKQILHRLVLAACCVLASCLISTNATAADANPVVNLDQVTATMQIEEAVDYVITGSTPFGTNGKMNFANRNATLILPDVKPSAAIKLLTGHVTIASEQAVDGTNCQVRLYDRGSIIFMVGDDCQPLCVYTEQNFEGISLNQFSLTHTGGHMNTLSSANLNNQIRSFTLRRGYMVTFSTRANGRGYSRCFIAADQDLEVPTLPAVLDQTISSYRIFKWFYTGKQAVANETSAAVVDALNVTSCYSFGLGESRLPDAECIPHHIYEDWPTATSCGSQTYSCHMKTNNEPRNTSDDHPQDIDEILANWENLMATGMRLCSPSSWDGSDYWNGTGFLKQFLDSIDARGWRCDIVDAHCYWTEGNFPNLQNWFNNMKRPIWISEWVWGASWNQNGAFASGVTEAQNAQTVQRICNTLNGMDYVERYFYWNSERDPSRLYTNGALTATGEMYAQLNTGLGYKSQNEFIPTNPRQYDPYACAVKTSNGKDIVTWADRNGEYNQSMEVQRRDANSINWETVATIELKETESTAYSCELDAQPNSAFRIKVVDVDGKARYSNESYNSIPEGNSTVQFGRLTLSDLSDGKPVEFTYAYEAKPALFVGPTTHNNSTTTVEPYFSSTNINKSGFTYTGLPWSYQPSGTTTLAKSESLPYLSIPFGNYEFGSMRIEVGSVTLKSDTAVVTFTQAFPEGVTPVVVATINRNTNKNIATLHKVWDVTNTGFKCLVQHEDGAQTTINLNQYLSYMAVTPGHECIDSEKGIYLAANVSTVPVYSRIGRSVSFTIGEGEQAQDLEFENPYIFAELQTKHLDVPTSLRLYSTTTNNVTDESGEQHTYTTSVRLRRVIDSSVSTPTDNSSSGDYVGWIVLHYATPSDQPHDDSEIIQFADAEAKRICVENWDKNGDGELSMNEAAEVTELGQVFRQRGITSFDELQYFTSVTSIDEYAFYECSNLASIKIPGNVTSIGMYAFRYCNSLTSIEIPKSVIKLWFPLFTGYESLTNIVVESGNPIYDSRDNCNAIIETASNTLLAGCKNTVIPNSVTIIGEVAFYECSGLTSFEIPNNVTSIKKAAFESCSNLTSVISEIEKPFAFGEFAFDGIAPNCTLTVPYGTKAAYIANGWTTEVFKGGIIDPKPDAYALVYMIDGEVFASDSIEAGTTITPLTPPTKEGYTFSGWSEIPEAMPEHDVVVTGTFTPLTELADEQGLRFGLLNNDGYAYSVVGYTDNMTADLTIPSEVNGLAVTSISDAAFKNATQLKSINIPESVTEVGIDVFMGATNLLVVEWNSPARVSSDSFDSPEACGNLLVYVNGDQDIRYHGNVVKNGRMDELTIRDGLPMRVTQEFQVGSVNFTREFTKNTFIGESAGWETLVLPFDVQKITHETKGEAKLFWLARSNENDNDNENDISFMKATEIWANVPYIISMPNNERYIDAYNLNGKVTFSAENVSLPPTHSEREGEEAGAMLVGTTEGRRASGNVYAINDELFSADGRDYMPGGVFVQGLRDIKPFEAYVTFNENGNENGGGGAKPRYIPISTAEGEASDIASLLIGNTYPLASEGTEAPIYDLSGRIVANSYDEFIRRQSNMKRGLYLYRNKKILIQR